jgi:hypothetical protein
MTNRYILQNFPIQEFVLVPSKCPFVNSRSYLNSTPIRTNSATSHDILQIQPIFTSLTEAFDNHIVLTTAFSTPLGIIVSSHGYAALHNLWYRVQSLCLSADTQNCRYKSNMAVMSWPWHIQKPCIALCFWDKMSWSCPAVPVVAASPDSIICNNQLWLQSFHHLVLSKRNEPRMQVSSYTVLQRMIVWAWVGMPGAQLFHNATAVCLLLC